MGEYKFIIHKLDRQSNYLKLELSGSRCIFGEFNNLGGKIIARFFLPKGTEITREIRDAFIIKAAELLKNKRKK